LTEMTKTLERLTLANTIPEHFIDMKTVVTVRACGVLEAILNLVGLQLVYFKTPTLRLGAFPLDLYTKGLGRILKASVVDVQTPYEDAVEKLKTSITEFNTALQDTDLLTNRGNI